MLSLKTAENNKVCKLIENRTPIVHKGQLKSSPFNYYTKLKTCNSMARLHEHESKNIV